MSPLARPSPTLCVHLIRHGETDWSRSGRHTGSTEIPLTDRGESQALELAWRLNGISFARILSSPRQRARQTGELVFTHRLADLEIEPDLAEWDYGDFEGQRSDEIRQMRPDWNLFLDGAPAGETPVAVGERADRLIDRLRAMRGCVAIFTHGHFGRVLAARWVGLPVSAGRHLQLGTASLSRLGYDPHHPAVPVIAAWNSTLPVEVMSEAKPALERWENEGGEIAAPARAQTRADFFGGDGLVADAPAPIIAGPDHNAR